MEVDEAFSLISHALDTGHAAHGYLIVGDLRGGCAHLTSLILAKLFPNDADKIAARSHPDIAYLEPEKAKRIITVESMREKIVEPMSYASFSGGWKVGVIVAADRMEPPSANAFLKSLEEPPPNTLYLMLTDQPDSILPTIVSRAQRVNLPLSEGLLEGDDYEQVASAFAARDAVALAAIIEANTKGKSDEDASEAQRFRKSFYKTLMSFVRRMMVEERLPRHQAFRNIEAVEDAFRQTSRSVKDDAVLSFLMDRIVFPKGQP